MNEIACHVHEARAATAEIVLLVDGEVEERLGVGEVVGGGDAAVDDADLLMEDLETGESSNGACELLL